MNTHGNISVNLCVKGIGAVEASVSGEGLGELINFLTKGSIYREIKRDMENLNDQ